MRDLTKQIDLDKLEPKVRARVERALREEKTVSVSTRTTVATRRRWETAARHEGKTLSKWMEEHLDDAARLQVLASTALLKCT